MAAIGSIRKHSTFLVIVIGVALAAFVLGDFTKGSSGRITDIGDVEGEKISIMEFNQKVDQNIAGTKQQQGKENLTQEEIFRLKDETWKQVVRGVLMNKEYEEIGLSVSTEELFDLVQGPNPHPLMKQYFVDPNTGQYDRNLVMNYLQNLDKMAPEAKQQWIQLEDYIKNDQMRTKFNALMQKGYYVPSQLAAMHYSEENDAASIEYVSVKYSTLSDSLVKVSDEDYKKYYNKHKETYEQKAQVDMDYVAFEVKPSISDLAAARKTINSVYEEFKTTNNILRFVTVNSDNSYDSTWIVAGQLPVQIDSLMFNSPVGTVARPYVENNIFYTARLVDVASRPDSLKASHILISYAGAFRADPNITRLRVDAQKLADSLLAVAIKSPKSFGEMATEFSDDPSAQANAGDLNWFADGMMVYAFNEAVVNGKVGDIVMTETQFGIHIIQITGKKPDVKKVRVAIISQEVTPSTETIQQTFALASKIASECKTKEEFDNAIETDKLNKRKAEKIGQMSDYIPGLTNARQIIRWAFDDNTEVNRVSEVFDLNNTFVVAVVTSRTEDGIPPLDAAMKIRINAFVTNEVKGEYLKKEIEGMNNNFDQIVTRLKGVQDEMSPVMFSTRNIKGYGTENEVIGTIFGHSAGQQFGPVAGQGAVFVVKVVNISKADPPTNYSQTVNSLESAFRSRVDQDFPYRALEQISEIEDNRMIFY
ncbi:MAG TPA: SurA N-terminal domain-containing protein [Bacteroidales bacterium]